MKCLFLHCCMLCCCMLQAQSNAFLIEFIDKTDIPAFEKAKIVSYLNAEYAILEHSESFYSPDSLIVRLYLDNIETTYTRHSFEYDTEDRLIFTRKESTANPEETLRVQSERDIQYSDAGRAEYLRRYDEDSEVLVPISHSTKSYDQNQLTQTFSLFHPIAQTYQTQTYITCPASTLSPLVTMEVNKVQGGNYQLHRTIDFNFLEQTDSLLLSVQASRLNNSDSTWLPDYSLQFSRDSENRIQEISYYSGLQVDSTLSLILRDSIKRFTDTPDIVVYHFESNTAEGEDLTGFEAIQYAVHLPVSDSLFTTLEGEATFGLQRARHYHYDEHLRHISSEFYYRTGETLELEFSEKHLFYYPSGVSTVGHHEKADRCILANPYPRGGGINCSFDAGEATSVFLYDFAGNQVFQQTVRSEETFSLPENNQVGLHLLQLKNQEGILWQNKIFLTDY